MQTKHFLLLQLHINRLKLAKHEMTSIAMCLMIYAHTPVNHPKCVRGKSETRSCWMKNFRQQDSHSFPLIVVIRLPVSVVFKAKSAVCI